jgi:hypothetical protein
VARQSGSSRKILPPLHHLPVLTSTTRGKIFISKQCVLIESTQHELSQFEERHRVKSFLYGLDPRNWYNTKMNDEKFFPTTSSELLVDKQALKVER